MPDQWPEEAAFWTDDADGDPAIAQPAKPTYECPAADECPGDPEGVEAAYQRGRAEGRAEHGRLPESVIGDGPCHDCGALNIRWFADSGLWNRVVGGPDARDDPGGIFCIHCFVKRADATGCNPPAWHLVLVPRAEEAKSRD